MSIRRTVQEMKKQCSNCDGAVLVLDKEAGQFKRICWQRDSDNWNREVTLTDTCLDWEEAQLDNCKETI